MTISDELLDELLKGCKRPEDLLGDAGLMKELKIRLMERMLGAELTAHLCARGRAVRPDAYKKGPLIVGYQVACQVHLPRRDELES
uniref:hypothetical protein n=1 Tax=Paracoccus kondratievae TaxID=135740 RepID=UPI001D0D6CE2|nr:hypothetical protein [Paracoccus kondratievae]